MKCFYGIDKLLDDQLGRAINQGLKVSVCHITRGVASSSSCQLMKLGDHLGWGPRRKPVLIRASERKTFKSRHCHLAIWRNETVSFFILISFLLYYD